MKKIVKEQNDVKTPFDLFSDMGETKIFAPKLVISDIQKGPSGKTWIVTMETDPNLIGGKTLKGKLSFDCSSGELIARANVRPIPSPNAPKPTPITQKVFSKKLVDFISNKYCSVPMTESKKIVRLSESDLERLVKKIIKEQKMEERPHDKMVFDCLTKDGFKPVNTGGKYALFLEKPKGGMKLQVSSQGKPTDFVMALLNSKEKKSVGFGKIVIGTTTNCDDIIKFANTPTRMMGAL